MSWVMFLFWVCWMASCGVSDGEDEVLTLAGFHPLSGDWADGEALRYVSDETVLHINGYKDLLPGYKLNITWIDSKVSEEIIIHFVYLRDSFHSCYNTVDKFRVAHSFK